MKIIDPFFPRGIVILAAMLFMAWPVHSAHAATFDFSSFAGPFPTGGTTVVFPHSITLTNHDNSGINITLTSTSSDASDTDATYYDNGPGIQAWAPGVYDNDDGDYVDAVTLTISFSKPTNLDLEFWDIDDDDRFSITADTAFYSHIIDPTTSPDLTVSTTGPALSAVYDGNGTTDIGNNPVDSRKEGVLGRFSYVSTITATFSSATPPGRGGVIVFSEFTEAIPEPSTTALVLLGGLVAYRNRRGIKLREPNQPKSS